MRLLAYNTDHEIIEKLESDEHYIVDRSTELDDALYHLQVRFYNLVIIYEDDLKNCLTLLQATDNTHTAFVVLTNKEEKKFHLKCFKNGALCVINTPFDDELLWAKLESIHRENFVKKIYHENYFGIDKEQKEIIDSDENQLEIRGKAYDILVYLYQNRFRPPISKDEMIYALWDDPEMVCQNVIEVNINQIRSKLKKRFQVDMIDTVRNRGYKLKN